MHFCHYTVFTHSLYCPLKFIKLKYILDTCSIYRFWRWTMDLTYKKLIYFCNVRKFHIRFFYDIFVEMLVISKISVEIEDIALKNLWNATNWCFTKYFPLWKLYWLKLFKDSIQIYRWYCNHIFSLVLQHISKFQGCYVWLLHLISCILIKVFVGFIF